MLKLPTERTSAPNGLSIVWCLMHLLIHLSSVRISLKHWCSVLTGKRRRTQLKKAVSVPPQESPAGAQSSVALRTAENNLATDCRGSAVALGHALWINTAPRWHWLTAATAGGHVIGQRFNHHANTQNTTLQLPSGFQFLLKLHWV